LRMAPPENTFPLGELEQRVHFVTKNFKEKSRKLPKDFDLKRDCELFELVQYSCTTEKQMQEQALADPKMQRGMECFPFTRLFRRYAVSVPYGYGHELTGVGVARAQICFTWRPRHGKASSRTSLQECWTKTSRASLQRQKASWLRKKRNGSGPRNEPGYLN
jgi:hypothetical protein